VSTDREPSPADPRARLFEGAPHGAATWQIDAEGALLLVAANAAASRLAGVDLGPYLQQPFAGIFPVSTLPGVLLHAARAQQATHLEPLISRDGRAFAADVVPLGPGAVGAIFVEIAARPAVVAVGAGAGNQGAGGEPSPGEPAPGEPAGDAPAAIVGVGPVAVPPAPPSSTSSSGAARGNILVIDDEPMVGRLVERALGRGHRVTAVTTGREGLDRLAAGERFDLILCDLMMPEITGMDMYERVVAFAPEQADRMVFLTGGAFTRRASEFLEERPFLEKPFDLRALEALVRRRVG
jgi:CheY-like chemotaxis protein